MADIFDLNEDQPNLEGPAKCLSCHHEWQASEPIGTTDLECPECKTHKGVFCLMTAPRVVWTCGCGNAHFYIDERTAAICSRCGTTQDFAHLIH